MCARCRHQSDTGPLRGSSFSETPSTRPSRLSIDSSFYRRGSKARGSEPYLNMNDPLLGMNRRPSQMWHVKDTTGNSETELVNGDVKSHNREQIKSNKDKTTRVRVIIGTDDEDSDMETKFIGNSRNQVNRDTKLGV